MFTTVNPQNRYIRFRGSGASINLGGQKEPVYQPTSSADIDAAFFGAGCSADEDQVDFDDLLSRLAGRVGLFLVEGSSEEASLVAPCRRWVASRGGDGAGSSVGASAGRRSGCYVGLRAAGDSVARARV